MFPITGHLQLLRVLHGSLRDKPLWVSLTHHAGFLRENITLNVDFLGKVGSLATTKTCDASNTQSTQFLFCEHHLQRNIIVKYIWLAATYLWAKFVWGIRKKVFFLIKETDLRKKTYMSLMCAPKGTSWKQVNKSLGFLFKQWPFYPNLLLLL